MCWKTQLFLKMIEAQQVVSKGMSQWCCVTLVVFVPKNGERLSTWLRAHEDVVCQHQTDPTTKFGPQLFIIGSEMNLNTMQYYFEKNFDCPITCKILFCCPYIYNVYCIYHTWFLKYKQWNK